jgi:FAD/FMN-containing dehydrogenase
MPGGERAATDLRHLAEIAHLEERRARLSPRGLGDWLRSQADDAEAEARLKKIWQITMEICLEDKATIAHHHGAGLARSPYIRRERTGDHHLLQRIKSALDPHNLMNPGKLGLND